MTETEMLRAQVDSLTKQLTAATNDAARAELRAKDLKQRVGHADECPARNFYEPCTCGLDALLTAAPDSDARLREVLWRAAQLGAAMGCTKTLEEIVDEVLGKLP